MHAYLSILQLIKIIFVNKISNIILNKILDKDREPITRIIISSILLLVSFLSLSRTTSFKQQSAPLSSIKRDHEMESVLSDVHTVSLINKHESTENS